MGDSDPDDYMSDKFLAEPRPEDDVRPGLVFQRSQKRKHELERKKKESDKKSKTVSHKELEERNRTIGLETAIASDNKGFALLQKMGYKPGMSLGKDGQGRKDPVAVSVKTDRGGLGREEAARQRRREVLEMRARSAQRRSKLTTEEFLHAKREKMMETQTLADLRKSQLACEDLDQKKGWTEPVADWYWVSTARNAKKNKGGIPTFGEHDDRCEPEQPRLRRHFSSSDEEDDEDEEFDSLTPSDKLAVLTDYLRDTYHFCIWCGAVYDDAEDLKRNCPGETAQEH